MRSGGRVTGLRGVRPGTVAVLAAGLMVPAVSAAASVTSPANSPSAVAAAAGPLMAWGSNAAGQLGDGTTNESDLPITVDAPVGLRATSARASNFSVAVTPAGKVLAWGAGQAGQLGNGHNRGNKRPVQVKLPSGVKVTAVRAGNDFTVALTTAGRVLTWGYGQYGELGNGASRSRDVPVRVRLPAATKITAVSAGYGFGLALTAAGQVLAWGDGASGDLGDGKTTTSNTPVRVRIPAGTKVTAVSAGEGFGLAVTSAGRVYGWGSNAYGELGDGTTTTRRTPVLVRLPAHTKVVSAFGGGLHSLALTASGAILAWGYNVDGELGDCTTTERLRPVRVLLSKSIKVTALAAGRYHSLALTADGRVLAWGSDSSGELGDGNTTSQRVPVVATVPGFALAIGAGPLSNTSLAIVRKIID
jgi:alpha-tubulin suppressor-like RCC1 family protein